MSFLRGFDKVAAKPLKRPKRENLEQLFDDKKALRAFPKGKDVDTSSVLDGPAGYLQGGRRYVHNFA